MNLDLPSGDDGSVRRLKVAVLSFAHPHALDYVRILSQRSDVELLTSDPDGARSTDPAPRGAELAALLGVEYAAGYTDALAWRPDAVIVTSENARHRELVEAAAAAGAHVLCEKPLATTVRDGIAMLDAARSAGVMLMTAYPVRFAPSFQDARQGIRAGLVGDVLAIRATNNGKLPIAQRGWFVDPELAGGGALVDHVVHCADLIDDLLGESPLTVRAASNRILHADAGVETGGLVTARYPSGVIATIDCSWSYPESANRWGGLTLEVIGTAGTVTVAPFDEHVDGFDEQGAVWEAVHDDLDAAMIDEFLSAVRVGREPLTDGMAGLRTLRVVAAAQLSALSGEVVSVRA